MGDTDGQTDAPKGA